MLITILKKNKLNTFTLPENVNGTYWISDFENGKKINLLNVEAKNGQWELISNQDVYIVDDKGVMIPSVILTDYSFKIINNNYSHEKYYLYTSPVYDKTYKELALPKENILTVGSDKNCNICYTLNGVAPKAFTIIRDESNFKIEVSENSSVYVNQKRFVGTKKLEFGDVIFLFGLKVILMRKNGANYVLVNNPNNLLDFNVGYTNIVSEQGSFIEKNEELTNDSLYKENNYFYRTPYFYKVLNNYTLLIDSPPSKKEEDSTPATLTIGPMITMSMASVVMLMSNVSAVRSGDKSLADTKTSMIMSGVMLASTLLWPLLTRVYQKFSDKRYEHKRQKMYKKYINKKEEEINIELELQRKSLIENNLSLMECQKIIKEHGVKLWQRRITDEDFLTIPVGIGNMPMKIEIKYPEEHFTLSEDNLMTIAYDLGKKARILSNVPITYSFKENIATGIVGEIAITKEFIDRVVLELMTNYSYDELKIITITSSDNEKSWEYMKVLPHGWSNDKTIRFFGSSSDDYREIFYVLEKIFNERRKNSREIKTFNTHYVIITDAIKSIDSYDFIKNIMSDSVNYGFSVIMMVDKISALPNECKNFIEVSNGECGIFSSVLNGKSVKFKIDFANIEELYNCAKELSNILIDIKSEAETKLPDTYQFLEMYQVGKVEQLNVYDRWKRSNPILSLQAPVGVGKSGEVIQLDLHEKYHGPHGLIAGTTGSGKSEFIISYILSLAVNYHPSEVQMILIDYKGGGLTSAFTNDMYHLPHLAGTITNLDGNELNRSLASIEAVIKR